jgi:hypothetical protein
MLSGRRALAVARGDSPVPEHGKAVLHARRQKRRAVGGVPGHAPDAAAARNLQRADRRTQLAHVPEADALVVAACEAASAGAAATVILRV